MQVSSKRLHLESHTLIMTRFEKGFKLIINSNIKMIPQNSL
jgi:hypothetical protein